MRIIYLALIELEVYNAPRTHTVEVCENFTKLGHKVLLLAPKPWKKKQKFSFEVVYVPFFGWGHYRELLFNIILSFYLLFYILKFKPDVVYERMLHNPLCLMIAKVFKKKHLLEVNGPPYEKEKILKNFLTAIEIKKAKGIIVPSPKLKEIIFKQNKIRKEKIKIILNGINTKIFCPQAKFSCRKKINLEENIFYLGYTGMIYWAYDFNFIFKALNKINTEIQNIKFIIVGPNKKEKLSENIIFMNSVDYKKVPLYINAFDLCLWPRSKKALQEGEILSTKLFEYIACGKKVLVPTLNNEGIPELFENFLVFYKYGDEEDFIKKIKELYNNRKLLEVKKEEIITFIKEYSWEETSKKIIKIINSKTIGEI